MNGMCGSEGATPLGLRGYFAFDPGLLVPRNPGLEDGIPLGFLEESASFGSLRRISVSLRRFMALQAVGSSVMPRHSSTPNLQRLNTSFSQFARVRWRLYFRQNITHCRPT